MKFRGWIAAFAFAASLLTACGSASTDDGTRVTEGRKCLAIGLCIEGYVWSDTKCGCVAENRSHRCATDADCRLFADYCTGCDCVVLESHQKDPTCSGPGVRCFADPCGGLTAYCNNGSCSAR